MAHLSRIASPKLWDIPRKGRKWITRTSPGPHRLYFSTNLSILLRHILSYSNSQRDVKKIVNNGDVKVDLKVRKDLHFSIGLMDTVSFDKLNENYRVLLNKKGKIALTKIPREEAVKKPFKILGKTLLKNKKIQLNLSDGRNILVGQDNYKVSDTIILDLTSNKIIEHIPFKEGSLIYLTSGNKIGQIGKINSITKANGTQPSKIIFTLGKTKHETLKEYAFVIGSDKASITLLENES